MSTRYYQEGSLERVSRAKGPDVWMYRWRNNKRVQRKESPGERQAIQNKAEAKREVENFRAENSDSLCEEMGVRTPRASS